MDNLRWIERLLRIAQPGSFATAGERLEVSPSAVSKATASFQARLGFSTFHRSTRRSVNGAAYLLACRDTMRDLERAELEGRERANVLSGTIMVAWTRV
jgi:DNA-binding transcriptional LysR family regulator